MSRTATLSTTIAALLLLVAPFPLAAQEPEADAGPEEAPDRWGAEVGFSLNSSGGNESLTVLIGEIGLTRLETEALELSLDGRFRYGRSEGEEVANSLRGGITADIWPSARWSPFVFATAERDRFKKLDLRLSGGTGLKRTFYQNDWDEVSLSAAVLYAYEDTDVDPEFGDGITETARWSWRGRARRQIREGTRLEQIVFYQPAWNEFDDYLIEASSSARVALTRTLAFTAAALYERDSTPAPEVGPDDWSVALGLSLAATW